MLLQKHIYAFRPSNVVMTDFSLIGNVLEVVSLLLVSWLLYVIYKIRKVSGFFVDWDYVILGFVLMWLRYALAFASPYLPYPNAVRDILVPFISLAIVASFIVGFEKIGSHFMGYGRK